MDQILTWLKYFSTAVPLEVFVLVGSIVEEVIAPIPTPLILGTAGFITHQHGGGWAALMYLAIFASLGKTFASWLFYLLGERTQDLVIHRWGKFFGLSDKHVQRFGKMMNGTWWDEVILVSLRIVPIIPTFVVSLGCGALRTPKKNFIVTTFLGSWVRSVLILALGAYGTKYAEDIWATYGNQVSFHPYVIAGFIGGFVGTGLLLLFIRQLLKRKKTQPSSPTPDSTVGPTPQP